MRPSAQVTTAVALAALALTAIAAASCSTTSTPPQQSAAESTRAKSAAPTASPGVKQRDRKIADTGARPTDIGPVSFADAEAAYRARKYAEAAGLFRRYVAERPDSGVGQFMLAMSAWKAGDLATAEQAFDAALAIDPNHVKSLMNMARVRIEQKRPDEAIALLTRASSIQAGSGEVHRLLGRAYAVNGDPDEAVDAYRQAIELDGQDAWSMNNLGLLLLEQQQAEEALPLLVKAVELRKDTPAFHNNLGMALEHTGRFRAAATAYKDALTADAAYGRARQNLARVEAVKGFAEEPVTEDTAQHAAPVEDARISRHDKTPGQ
jgi:tetratricopeptide (TPR) repeat protein